MPKMPKMPKVKKQRRNQEKAREHGSKAFLLLKVRVKIHYFFFPMEVRIAKSSLHSL